MNFTITELESYLNVTDNLINDLVRKGNMNTDDTMERYKVNNKLSRLHAYRKEIINLIENKLDETFNRKSEE